VQVARRFLLRASRSQWLARQLRDRSFLRRAAQRFMPGEEPGAALAAAATLAREDFTSLVLEKLDRTGLPGDALVIEVTEQSLIDDVRGAAARLGELRQHGIKIALDDFGTGYSSLSSLQDLPVDKLKLDRSFLARGVTAGVISPLLRTVVTLGHDLGMEVVAEGIETQEHFEAMRMLGCDVGQGWLLSRPMPPEDVFRHLSAPSVATAPVL
jgi:EAL domain-containing protein (putative c-di-GMP-specific phosphodiesterase class I)